VFGFFVMSANLPHKDYFQLFPLFENGWTPVWKGILYTTSGLIEISIILFMQQHLQQPPKLKGLLILIIVLGWMIMGPLTGAIAEFGLERAAQLRYPAFEEWRLVNLGRYVEHLDFLSIYQWLSGAYIRLSLSMFLIVDMFQVAPGKKRTLTLGGLYLLLTLTLLFPINDIRFVQLMFTMLPALMVLIVFLSISLTLLVVFHRRKRTVSS
ncbi:MAG: GerAB/ArcD/ProY family transporter, partial [Clostridia bacterium]